jgi:TRAP transporter TAXI family solute receptor
MISVRKVTLVASVAASFLIADVQNAATSQSGRPETGYALKKPVFGGATQTNGWGAIGVIVKEAMKHYGWDVQLCTSCAGAARAARLVAAAAVPRVLNPNDPSQPNGPLDFGATGSQFLWWAYQGKNDFARDPEGPRRQLRLVANIQTPSYMFVAVKAELGITDLRQITERRLPVRIFVTSQGGAISPTILSYYGLTKESLESSGGRLLANTPEDQKTLDIIIGFGAASGEYQEWLDVNQRLDLRYLELPKELRTRLTTNFDLEERDIPIGLFRSIERPIPTVVRTGTVLYGRQDMPDDFAYTLAKAMDEHQELLQWVSITYSYNPNTVWKAFGVPLHPGAARYYRERGYMK